MRHPNDTTEPDPTLFAELQTALQPQAGQRGTAPITGIDRALAGLTAQELAAGGGASAVRRAPVASAPARPVLAAAQPAGQEVEIIRGDRRDTVRY